MACRTTSQGMLGVLSAGAVECQAPERSKTAIAAEGLEDGTSQTDNADIASSNNAICEEKKCQNDCRNAKNHHAQVS